MTALDRFQTSEVSSIRAAHKRFVSAGAGFPRSTYLVFPSRRCALSSPPSACARFCLLLCLDRNSTPWARARPMPWQRRHSRRDTTESIRVIMYRPLPVAPPTADAWPSQSRCETLRCVWLISSCWNATLSPALYLVAQY